MKRGLSLSLLIITTLQCFAQTPGTPDPAWGINGKIVENFGFSPFTVVTTGINSPELDRNIIIAPNPVDGDLNIKYTGNFARFNIAILDLSGKQVFAKAQFNFTFILNMRKFSSGAYVVKIVNAKTGEQIHRLIMKK